MSDNSKKFDDLLPSDEELCRRSKRWAKIFEKYENVSDNESIDIENFSEDELDEQETIDPSEFEDNRNEDDPSFNLKDVLNQTNKVIAKRKARWNECGIDRILDTFCYVKIAEKVGSWLKNNIDYLTPETNKNNFNNYVNAIEINEQKIIMERSSDRNSSDSVDTAKYILSNRKRQKSKVTMTIKNYCYSAKNAHLSCFDKDKFLGLARKPLFLEDDVFSDQVREVLSKNIQPAIRSKSDSYYKRESPTPEMSPAKKQKWKSRRSRPRNLSISSSSVISERRPPPPKKRTPRAQPIRNSPSLSGESDNFKLKTKSPKNYMSSKKSTRTKLLIDSTALKSQESLSQCEKPKKQISRTKPLQDSSSSSVKKISQNSSRKNSKTVPSDLSINSTDVKSQKSVSLHEKQVPRAQVLKNSSSSNGLDHFPMKSLSPRKCTPSKTSTKTNIKRAPTNLPIDSTDSESQEPSPCQKPKMKVSRTKPLQDSSSSSSSVKKISQNSSRKNSKTVPSDLLINSTDVNSQKSVSLHEKQVPRAQVLKNSSSSNGLDHFPLKSPLSPRKCTPSKTSTKTNIKRAPTNLPIDSTDSESQEPSPCQKPKMKLSRTKPLQDSSSSSSSVKKISQNSSRKNSKTVPSDLSINSTDVKSQKSVSLHEKQVPPAQVVKKSSSSNGLDHFPLKSLSPRKCTPSKTSTKTNIKRAPTNLPIDSTDSESQEPSPCKKPKMKVSRTRPLQNSSSSSVGKISQKSSRKNSKTVSSDVSINSTDVKSHKSIPLHEKLVPPAQVVKKLSSSNGLDHFPLKSLSPKKCTPSKTSRKTNIKRAPSDLSICNNSIINSTALKSQESMIDHKENFYAACEKANVSNNRIFKNQSQSKKINKNNKLQIIDEDSPEKVGSTLKKKNLNGDRKSFNHDAKSKLTVIVDLTSDSETDILETLGNQRGLVQEVFL